MHTKRSIAFRSALALAVAAAAVAAAPAIETGPAADEPAPTTVGDVTAAVGADTIEVSAAVDLGGQAPVVLAFDSAGDGAVTGETSAAGLDLTGAVAYAADGDEDVVTFEWQVTDLPAAAPPPEAVRYYWEFGVAGTQYALQVKFSDLVSTNSSEDPVGFAEHVGNTFRLRGNCGSLTPVVTVGNCSHVAWLTGEFDADANAVRVHLPMDLDEAPALRPGAMITPDPDGGEQIWASVQAALDNANTRDATAQFGSYAVPAGLAFATLRDAGGATVATGALDLSDGAATGSLSTTGIAAGDYTLEVDACFAGNCATSVTTVTL